jgi:HEAT repeat protein
VHELHAGWTAVPALGELLKDEDNEVRQSALHMLSFIVSSANPEDQFKTSDGNQNGTIELAPWAELAIPLYISSMHDDVDWIRWQATEHLGSCAEFGLDVREAVPSLIHLLADDDCRVRAAAASVLGTIGPDAKDSIVALSELRKDTSTYTWKDVRGPQGTVSVSEAAAIALKRIDPTAAAKSE